MLLTNIRRFYFSVFVGIALLVYIAQQFSFPLPPLINNYLNDLLCLPIVLKICKYVVQFINSDKQVNIPIKISLTLTIVYSIYFEVVLPTVNSRYTGDLIDVVLYFLGFLFFLWIEKSELK